MNFVTALACNRERRAEFPAVGNFQRSRVGDVVGFPSLGIKQDLVPTDDGKFVGGGGACGESSLKCCWGEEVEFGVDLRRALGNFDVDGETIEKIATPFERLPTGFEEETSEVVDWTVRGVLARDPLRIVQSEIPSSRGDLQGGVEYLARSAGGIDEDGDVGAACCPSRN